MSSIDFNQLPDSARIWIFGSIKPLKSDDIQTVERNMDDFVREWIAHKKDVLGSWTLVHDRFICIGADESAVGVSGCSIDSMVGNLRTLEQRIDSVIADSHSSVFFRDNEGAIQAVSRQEYKYMAEKSVVSGGTIVFDNTVQTVGDFRNGKWELQAKYSWHSTLIGAAVS